jgi:hypothetical protein
MEQKPFRLEDMCFEQSSVFFIGLIDLGITKNMVGVGPPNNTHMFASRSLSAPLSSDEEG